MTRKTLHGTIRETIELSEDLGLNEGQEVQITLEPAKSASGEGLIRWAGVLAAEWTEEDDRILEMLHHEGKKK